MPMTLHNSEIVATLREGLLVLTEDLIIEYASDQFLRMFEVSRADTLGRPLADLGDGQWNIPSLLKALARIVENDETLEDFEVEHQFDRIGRKVMRLNARKTVRPGNGSKRMLLAIDDVTQAADQAKELGRLRRLSQGIVDTLREPLLVLDSSLTIIQASRAFYRTFKEPADRTIGRNLADLGNGQWADAQLLALLKDVIPRRAILEDHEIKHDFPRIGTRVFLLNARQIVREGNNMKTVLLAMEDVTEARRLEAERDAALDHSHRLLEELNHRVMNSMSMIGAVISMEARTLNDQECRDAFERMRNRINSIATLYRGLTRSAAIASVMADDYLAAVFRDTVGSTEISPGMIGQRVSIDPIVLSTRIAVPLALVINELATNSMKHAYKDRETGIMGLSLVADGQAMTVTMWDDGPGVDQNARVDSGLGQKLVEAFVEQLGGELVRTSDQDGTRYVLRIPRSALDDLQD